MSTVCKKLKFQNRWLCVDPSGMSDRLLVCWSDKVVIHNVITSHFCIELECSGIDDHETFWVVFMYASTDIQIRREQWDYLVQVE